VETEKSKYYQEYYIMRSNDIKFTKKQIWSHLYLTVIAIIGMVTLYELMSQKTYEMGNLFFIIIISIGFFSCLIISYHYYSIEDYRIDMHETSYRLYIR
jgi:hypothetical protein